MFVHQFCSLPAHTDLCQSARRLPILFLGIHFFFASIPRSSCACHAPSYSYSVLDSICVDCSTEISVNISESTSLEKQTASSSLEFTILFILLSFCDMNILDLIDLCLFQTHSAGLEFPILSTFLFLCNMNKLDLIDSIPHKFQDLQLANHHSVIISHKRLETSQSSFLHHFSQET